MGEEKWTIDELEMLYLTEYDEDNIGELDCGDDVQNFFNWCRNHISRMI